MNKDILERLETSIQTGLQEQYSLTSIAISLKRIADKLETIPLEIHDSIYNAIVNATRR